MLQKGIGVPTPMNCPIEAGESKPLIVRVEQLHRNAQKVLDKAEKIFGELYSVRKTEGSDCCEPSPSLNLDSTINDTSYVLSVLDSCLSEILYRLNGE
ncbi:hypothetical protein [Peribacillus acanthi]|uniref:hypothetical protein n=1 Tax=Peribacillus acanthi TaxID=2171554 RepID=UPI000D3EDAD4|nr:hypothetical protein [Peribacillus acanthi]